MKFLQLSFCLFVFTAYTNTALAGFEYKDAYAFATSKAQKNGAVFMTILSDSDYIEKIVGAESKIAERVELHTNDMAGGVMNMRRVDYFEVPKVGGKVLEPMGDHIMLIGLKDKLRAGESFDLYLHTQRTKLTKAGPFQIEVQIVPPGQKP